MRNAIALAAHPANKDASAETVLVDRINGRSAVVFKVTNGFVPGYCGMTAPGYMPDIPSAVEWLEAYAGPPVKGASLVSGYPLNQKGAAE